MMGAYPSQVNPLGDDGQDEALLQKLNDLEGYLATNPNKNQQMQNPMNLFNVQPPTAQATPIRAQAMFNVQQPQPPVPIHDPYYFNVLANPSGNRQLDDMERAYKLRQDVDRCEDLESEEKAMVNL